MKQKQEVEIESKMTEYELACATAVTAPQMDNKTFHDYVMNMSLWFSQPHRSYFMFLNNELHDYTIFNFIEPNYAEGMEELKKLILSRGVPVAIDYNHEHDYYEVWVRDVQKKSAHMYILFVCDDFMIEIGAKNYGKRK